MRAVLLRFLSSMSLFAIGASSCVPADTRPVPAMIALEISPNDASQQGITTTDGWTITIDRFLVNIGEGGVGEACIAYSDADYTRLIDAKRTDDQKLALLFGLGRCGLDFRISGPESNTILGAGVTEEDALILGLKGVDPYVTQESSAAISLSATASRGSSTARLSWSFRRRISYRDCETPVDGKPAKPLDFPSNANLTYHIVLHPEVLLRDDDVAAAALRFDTIASADTLFGNADGEVTLSELGAVTLDEARKTGPYGIGAATAAANGVTPILTLEDYVYLVLLPAIPQFREDILCPLPKPRQRED